MTRSGVIALVATFFLITTASAQTPQPGELSPEVSLSQAIQYAIDHYPSVRASLEQVNAATAGVAASKAAYLPRFDSVWQTNRATANNIFGQLLPQSLLPPISGPVLSTASSQSAWGSAIGGLLSWEPFDFGGRGAAVREAEAALTKSQAQQTLTLLEVQQAVASAFLTTVSAQQAVAAAEADASRRETLARTIETLVANELRPGAEASRASAERAAAETRVIQARQALSVARAMLAQLLGVESGTVTVRAAGLLEPIVQSPAGTAPVLPHPLLASAQASIEMAQAREDVVATTFRPHVFLQSSVFARGSGANASGTFDGGADGLWPERANWAAGVQVVFPNAFDLVGVRARHQGATAATRAERARYEEAALMLRGQQRAADAMVEAARAIAQNTPLQLAAARQTELQARARYDAGLASIVEVAEAQNLLVQAEYQDAMARVDVWRSLLAQATAGGDLTPFVERARAAGNK